MSSACQKMLKNRALHAEKWSPCTFIKFLKKFAIQHCGLYFVKDVKKNFKKNQKVLTHWELNHNPHCLKSQLLTPTPRTH